MPDRIDLHCHTTASDGRLSPTTLVQRAASDDVDVIGVSDHDTVDGIDEALAAARAASRDVVVVASIELSARWQGRNVHVLGPFLDHRSAPLRERLTGLRLDRARRAGAIVDRLNALGYELAMHDVLAEAGEGVVARPHIARALVARGHVASVRDAFTPDLIADGGAADVPKQALTPVEAVELIRSAGGAPVVAHPGVGHHEGAPQPLALELLASMRDAGMVGLEVDHPDHDPLMREHMARVAADLGLIACGGSDFHGDEGHVLCRASTSPEALEALRAAAAR
jgi:predicted metal-dependent phosphoesterase TrpH